MELIELIQKAKAYTTADQWLLNNTVVMPPVHEDTAYCVL